MKNHIFIISLLVIASCTNKSAVSVELSIEDLEMLNLSDTAIANEFVYRQDHEDYRNADLSLYADTTIKQYLRKKGILGQDDRFNIYSVSEKYKSDAEKVVCFILVDNLKPLGNGDWELTNVQNFKESFRLCDNERFALEPVPGFCSGFAIKSDQIATAGHCIDEHNYKDYVCVFNFAVNKREQKTYIIKSRDIFKPTGIVRNDRNYDVGIIKVDKRIPANRIVKCRTQGKISDHQKIHVIGHPCGLPLKVTINAKVYYNNEFKSFIANCDTYGGNSGSPVFNSETHEVEGILVGGGQDFEFDDKYGCRRSYVCPENIGNCAGESVVRILMLTHTPNK